MWIWYEIMVEWDEKNKLKLVTHCYYFLCMLDGHIALFGVNIEQHHTVFYTGTVWIKNWRKISCFAPAFSS